MTVGSGCFWRFIVHLRANRKQPAELASERTDVKLLFRYHPQTDFGKKSVGQLRFQRQNTAIHEGHRRGSTQAIQVRRNPPRIAE